jgi:hypothetical protein
MTDPNDCYAYFALYGDDLDPAAVSAELDAIPTQAWRKGDLDQRQRERKTGHWSLYSRLSRASDLQEHVADVLDQMEANSTAYAQVGRRFGGTLQLVGYFHDIGVGLNLSKDVIARLAHYGLDVDVDFYYLYSDRRECTD